MSNTRCRRTWVLGGFLFLVLGGLAAGQDVRGTISGRITDASGGVLARAEISVENVATGLATSLKTNETGQFHALYLAAGTYRVTVKADGFRTVVRDKVELRVEGRVILDLQLDPAVASEEIEVVAVHALLETATATSGQVVDAKTIEEMPLGDGTAYFLARLAPGVEFTADPKFTRPMDNVNLAGVTASGVARRRPAGETNTSASTEFMLDGVPNHVSENRLGFSPPSPAVQEFKVSTTQFDAQFGQGAGGSVSLGLKSGTNELKGEVSYYNRDESRSANTFFKNATGDPKDKRDYHRATMMLSGPVQRNRTFFMVAGEYLYDNVPEPFIGTVPTEKQRNGDFSETPNIIIYNPFSSRRVPDGRGGTKVERDPFPGNIIPPSLIDPIARKVLSYYPMPNRPRDQWGVNQTRNFFSDRNRTYDYYGGVLKLDHQLDARNRLFLNLIRNWRAEDRSNWSETPATQGLDWRANTAALFGWTSTVSSSSILDVRVGAHKFGEWQRASLVLSPSDFGFGPKYLSLTRDYAYMPRFDMDTYPDIGNPRASGKLEFDRPHWRYTLLPTFTKIRGNHTVRTGLDLRMIRETEIDAGYPSGNLEFRSGNTNAGTAAAGVNTHRDLAALLLGAPTAGRFDTNAERHNQVVSSGVFLQDDWRISPKLTVNVGLRWEVEWGMTERENRNARGFELTTPNPLEAAARARLAADFAANPGAFQVTPGKFLVTPDSFQAKGGYLFADSEHRDIWRTPHDTFLPRLGVAYQLGKKTVVRGGVGLYAIPYTISGVDQRGFSRSTDIQVVDAQGLPRTGVFQDPIPGGLRQPLGAALGLLNGVGGSIGDREDTIVPYDRKVPRFARFQVGFQRELPADVLFELNYVGSRGSNLVVQRPMNFLPAEYLIDSPVRDQAAENFLSGSVPNPFRGLPPVKDTSLDRDQITRENLLRRFPQFSAFSIQEHTGSNRYDSIQIRMERRFSRGFLLSANYTYSRLRETLSRLYDSDRDLVERVSTEDRPQSYKLSTVMELPFGKGRRWGSEWSGFKQAVFGGWSLAANYLWQEGQPISFDANDRNVYYDPSRNPNLLRTRYGKTKDGKRLGVDVPAFDTTGFYFHDTAVQRRNAAGQLEDDPAKQISDPRINRASARYVRIFPDLLDNMRLPPFHNLDVGLRKTFDLKRAQLQIRIDAYNAENFAHFDSLSTDPRSSDFGLFDAQRNLPRDIQIGARLTF